MDNRIRAGIFTFGGLCILLVLLAAYNTVIRIGKYDVSVSTLPEDAAVYINKEKFSGTQLLPAGEYEVTVEKEGWVSQTQTAVINDDSRQLYFVLNPDSDEAEQEAAEDGDYQTKREEYTSLGAQEQGDESRRSFPIINRLPYSDLTGPYKIDYGFQDDARTKLLLVVSYTTSSSRKEALRWIKKYQPDISNVLIEFDDYIGPLKLDNNHTHEDES